MSSGRIDYHIHTSLCRHAEGSLEEYAEKAYSAGLVEIAFADHIPIQHPILAESCMKRSELDGYVEKVLDLREAWKGRMTVRLGLEADYVDGYEEYVSDIIDAYPFDVILGSVHTVDGWGVDNEKYIHMFEQGNIEEMYFTYFTHVEMAAKTGMFDVMAHPDLIKKFGYVPDLDDWSDLYAGALDAIAGMGVGMEVNSSGLRKPIREQYPCRAFLKEAVRRGVKFVTGSDAHAPEEVGMDFDFVYTLLREEGVEDLLTFSRRKRGVISINDKGRYHDKA